MIDLRLAATVLGLATILSSNNALEGQTFTWGAARNIDLPMPAVFTNLSPMDMNGDGKTDICLSMWDPDSTGEVQPFKWIYQGDGDGNFASTPVTATESPNTYAFGTVQFFDVNGDGYADEVYSYAGFTASNGKAGIEEPGVFAVLLGDGKGNFIQTTSIPQPITLGNDIAGNGISILAAGSFRNNGRLDFATIYRDPSKPGQSVLTVYLNDGGGIFHVGATMEVASGEPLSPVTGDFNGDGHLDIAWADNSPQPGTNNRFALHCVYGNGDGTFRADEQCYTTDGPPEGLAAANLNGDHKSDLVLYTGAKVGTKGALPRVATLLAKQTSGFYWLSSSSVSQPTSYGISSTYGMPPLKLEDLNGDGNLDVILSGQMLFAGSASGAFGKEQNTGFPGNYNPAYFAPLKQGGLPAMFYSANDDGDFSTKLSWQLNTSAK